MSQLLAWIVCHLSQTTSYHTSPRPGDLPYRIWRIALWICGELRQVFLAGKQIHALLVEQPVPSPAGDMPASFFQLHHVIAGTDRCIPPRRGLKSLLLRSTGKPIGAPFVD